MTVTAAVRGITMGDPAVYLEKLSIFSRMLRLEGLTVGVQETADAAQILISLGLTDREQVKAALRTVFAKSREEQASFDRVFDGFFVSEETMRQQAKDQMERGRKGGEKRKRISKSAGSPCISGKTSRRSTPPCRKKNGNGCAS